MCFGVLDGTTTYIDTGLEGTVTGSAAALLATNLLCAVRILTAILGLCSSLTLVGEVLYYIKINRMVIRCHTEYLFVKSDFLSGIGSVDFVN